MSDFSEWSHVRLGIFARTFPRASLIETLAAVREAGFHLVQLNLSSAGLPTLPESLSDTQVAEIAMTLFDHDLRIAAISGTFNMIDPDLVKRADDLRRLDLLASKCRAIGTSLITLCTGTRDPHDMWKCHPDNAEASAWSDLVASMQEAVAIADRHDITFAFEPEISNVVDSVAKARKLLDEIGSPRLKVVLDVANLIRPGHVDQTRDVIDEAFDLLANDVALVHAKDIAADGSVGEITPGCGVLDYAHLLRRYAAANLDVPIIVHGLLENGARDAFAFMNVDFTFLKSLRIFTHDGIAFRYLDRDAGLPLVFQHGLSGDLEKMHQLVLPQFPARLISFDARYHGESLPLGPPEKIGFDQSVADLLALLDHLKIEKAVIGGLSMGAGIALNFAIHYPERTLALILSRPAWLDEPFPENVRMFPDLALLLRLHGPKRGREEFLKTAAYASVIAQSADSASALLGMFDDPSALETVERFERIPRDCPSTNREDWKSIRVPTLVLANHQDPIHPFAIGATLAAAIPGAELQILTPKCVDAEQHATDFNTHVSAFLRQHFPQLQNSLN